MMSAIIKNCMRKLREKKGESLTQWVKKGCITVDSELMLERIRFSSKNSWGSSTTFCSGAEGYIKTTFFCFPSSKESSINKLGHLISIAAWTLQSSWKRCFVFPHSPYASGGLVASGPFDILETLKFQNIFWWKLYSTTKFRSSEETQLPSSHLLTLHCTCWRVYYACTVFLHFYFRRYSLRSLRQFLWTSVFIEFSLSFIHSSYLDLLFQLPHHHHYIPTKPSLPWVTLPVITYPIPFIRPLFVVFYYYSPPHPALIPWFIILIISPLKLKPTALCLSHDTDDECCKLDEPLIYILSIQFSTQ